MRARDRITPGTSALFLYTRNVVQDRVFDEFKDVRHHMVLIQSNLSKEQEDTLRDASGEEPAATPAPPAASAGTAADP